MLSDVGSTKQPLAGAGADERFVGGHPLAGAETSGVEHARADLFDGATWYLTPGPGTAGVLYERLHRLLVGFGARPTAIDPETHDRLMAGVSHLPHVLANVLVNQAAGLLGDERRAAARRRAELSRRDPCGRRQQRDLDRHLHVQPGRAARRHRRALRASAGGARLAGRRTAPAVRAWNERSRVERDALLGAGLVGGPVHELRASVPNRPGVIAEIALALGAAGVNIVDMALSPSADHSQGSVAFWIRGDEHAQRALELIAGLGFPVVQA